MSAVLAHQPAGIGSVCEIISLLLSQVEKSWVPRRGRGCGSDPHHFNLDPGPAFHYTADQDPAHPEGDANLWLLVYRLSRTPFWASKPPLWASTALHRSILSLINFFFIWTDPDLAFHSKADPDLASKIMRINADPDPQDRNPGSKIGSKVRCSKYLVPVPVQFYINELLGSRINHDAFRLFNEFNCKKRRD